MKTRLRFQTVRRCATASIAAATLIQFTATADTWQVNVDDHLLYADPNPPQNQLKLGGLSGLVAVPGDGSGTLFYAVTDRGPNGDDPAGTTAKFFPVPSFNPSILTIQLLG